MAIHQLSLRAKVALFAIVAIIVSTLPMLGLVIIQKWESNSADKTLPNHSATQSNPQSNIQSNTETATHAFPLAELGVVGLQVILVGGMAIFLSDRVIRPVLQASSMARKLGQGQLETRLAVQGKDELAVLATNLNWMAEQFQSRSQQSAAGQQLQLLKQVTLDLSQSQQVDQTLTSVVQAIRQGLQYDRVLVYRLNEAREGVLVAESVAAEWMSTMGKSIEYFWLQSTIEQAQGFVEAISDVAAVALPESYLKQWVSLSTKASLTAPIVIRDQVVGILVAHQCLDSFVWKDAEIDVWTQLAVQIGLAWERTEHQSRVAQLVDRAEMMTQKHQYQQSLVQFQLIELLEKFASASNTDLTVVAAKIRERDTESPSSEMSSAEICEVIAEVFDTTLAKLYGVVIQTEQAVTQLDTAIADDEQAVCHFSETTIDQSKTIAQMQSATEDLMLSLQSIVLPMRQVSDEVRQIVLETAETQGQLFERAEQESLRQQKIATEVIEQVNQFSQDCQNLNRLAALVNQMLLQLKILTFNASLEAVQELGTTQRPPLISAQIRELLIPLQEAAQEIEQSMFNFQSNADKVVKAIKRKAHRLSPDQDLSEMSEQQVRQIQTKSNQVEQTVQLMANTAEIEIATAQVVVDCIQKLSSQSKEIASNTTQVIRSRQQFITVAQQLQKSIQALNGEI